MTSNEPKIHERYLLGDDQPAPDEKFKAGKETQKGERGLETIFSQESVIVSANTAIVAFEGLNDQHLFEGERIVPETELSEDQTRILYQRVGFETYNFYEAISKADKDKIYYNFVINTVKSDEIREKFGELDPSNLSPFQAAYIASLTVIKNIKYDFGAVGRKFSKIGDPEYREFVKEKAKDSKEFEIWKQNRNHFLDNSTCDELLHNGYGTCRHMAATCSAIYEAIKSHQTGDSLKGTYMFYHAPRGKHAAYKSDENHAYNVFAVVSAENKTIEQPQTQPEILFSIVDPTWGEEDELEEMDQTLRRLSSVISFVINNGRDLGLKDYVEEVVQLASNISSRIKKIPDDQGRIQDILSVLEVVQPNEHFGYNSPLGHVIDHLEKARIPSFILDCYEMPKTSVESANGVRYLKKDCIPPVYEAMRTVDFTAKSFMTEKLGDLAIREVGVYLVANESQKINFVDSFKQNRCLLEQCLRYYVDGSRIPEASMLTLLEELNGYVEYVGYFKRDEGLKIQIERFRKKYGNSKAWEPDPLE